MTCRVLITGASGFLGSHLIDASLSAGLEVHAAVRRSSDIAHLQDKSIAFSYPDFSSVDSLRQVLQENHIDYIIHSAGATKAPSEAVYNTINADYTRNLAIAAKNAGVKKMVFLSSLAVTGPLDDALGAPLTEESPLRPITAYGRSKMLAEQYIHEVNGVSTTILRPTAVYGPREKDIFIMFRALSRGLEPYIGRGAQTLSFVYGPDVAKLAVQALDVPFGGTYLVTDGKRYDRYALAAFAKLALKKSTLKFHVPMSIVQAVAGVLEKSAARRNKTPALNRENLRQLSAAGWQCDISKARKELGFAPAYDLESGVQQTVEWYRQQGWI